MPARVVSDEEDDVYVDEEEEEEAGRLVDRDAEEDEEGNRVGDEDEDEDEEDEEGQDEYEKDGFIVDEDEDGEEEEEEEEEEGRKKKRKKKRESERNYVLDEDDYELLEDNVGFRRPEQSSKKFKRLKKAGRDTEEERSGFSDDEVLGGEGKDGRTAEEKLKRSLFGDDETVPLEDIAEEEEQQEEEEDMDMVEEDEMADFIVDEEDVDENGAPMPRRKIKKKKPRQAPGVSSSALQEAHEIFGDVDELLKLRKEGLERTGADSRGWVDRRIEDEFEPHIVQKNYMTPKDEMIRDTDIPERIQMIEELTGPPPVDDISIEEEASWIYNQLTSGGILSHFDHRRAVRDINKDDIGNVLTMLHVQKLDIPFITMYRKELCLSLFKDPDDQDVNLLEGISDHTKTPRMRRHTLFWAIQTLDVKWLLIQKRKSALHSYYTKRFEEEARRIYDETRLALNRQVFESIIDALKDAKSEREVDDVDMKFNLHFPPGEVDFEEGQYKRPKRKSLYSTCHKAGLWEVANKFGRSSEQFGASFECMRAADELEDAKETPEEVAANFTCVLFEKPEDVLKGARHMASVEISCEPNVRKHVRTTFMENCVISTIPTAEGNMVIDEFHQFYEVKWLKEKPFSSFINAQWLLAQKAEEEKLLKVTIKLPGAIQEKLMTDARDYYLSLNMSRTAKMWNEQRQRILDDSFFNFILPSMEKEARSLLTSKAKSWLLMEYGRQLWKWVSVAPYVKAKPGDKTESEEESALRVIACSWGPGKSGITFVALDSSGELLDVMQAGTLPRKSHGLVEQRKRNDEQRLLKFISDHRPEVFSIGATNTHCTDLKDWISEINYKILEERENSFYNGPEVPLFFADEALPRVYENSQVSSDQLSGQQGIVRRAVALGRYLQNPLAMVATLCGIEREILSCKLCPLENFLTADEKYGMVEQVMVDATNQVGIDLNMACGHEWLLAPLQFTSGLGPRKAAALQRAFVRAGSVLSRKEIMMGVIRKKVFVNASGFLRVRPCGAAGTSGYVMDLLDDTRIHPESYDLAKQMAKDVYSHDDSDEHVEIEDDVQEMVIEQIRENPHQLELLMIEEYHKSVEAEKNCRKLETLYDIKRELIRGFQDCRTPYIEPDADELFRMVSGETDESISEGKIVQVTVRYVQEQRVSCSLDSGLHGFISIGDFSDQRLESSELQEMVHKDDMLTCKIKRVEKNRFLVHLTHKDGDLNRKHVPKNLDRFFVEGHAHIRNEDIARKEKEMGKKNFKPRMIVHPRFHNWTSEEAIEFLVDKEIGESVFRPSVRGPSHLTLTIKVYEGLYTHKDIDESDKDHKDITSLLRLGKKLSIGKDTFEDLDELVDRYVDPLVSRLKSMYAYRKFREGNQAEVEDLLRKEKAEYPMRIVYCFSIADKHPGIFVLTYIRSTAPHHRYVAVYPTGFRFQQRDFDDIDRLVAYFQKHIDDNPTSNMSMRSLAAVVPMRSPAPVDSSSRDSVDDGWSGGGWQAQNDSEGERLTPGSRVDHRHDGSSREGHPSGLPRSSGRGRGRGRGTHDSQVLGYDSTKWGPGSKENDGMSSFPGAKVQNSPGRERFPGSWGGGGRSGGRGDWGAKAQDSPGRERFPGSWGGSGGSGGSGGWRGAKAQDSPARERFPGSWGGGGGNSGGGGAKGQDSPGRERFPGSWGGGGSSQDSSGKERFPGSWSRGGTSGSSGSWGSKHQDSPGGERFPRGGGGGGGRDGGGGSGGGRDGGGGSGGGWGARVQDSPGGKERFPGSWGGGGGGWSGGSKHDGGGSDEGGGGWGGGSKHDGGGDDGGGGWGGGSKHDGDDGGSTTSNRGRNTREGGDSDGWNAAGSEGNNGGHTRRGNNWGN